METETECVSAYTVEDFIRTYRPDGKGHIVIEDERGDVISDTAFDEVICDSCNADITQPDDNPFRTVVFVADGWALCEDCANRMEDEGEEPSLLNIHARKRGGADMVRFNPICPCGNRLEKAKHPWFEDRKAFVWNCFKCFPDLIRLKDLCPICRRREGCEPVTDLKTHRQIQICERCDSRIEWRTATLYIHQLKGGDS